MKVKSVREGGGEGGGQKIGENESFELVVVKIIDKM